jgi:hypothetical protein
MKQQDGIFIQVTAKELAASVARADHTSTS